MKNRRSIIIAFLLCACMIVGVGYAAFSDVMDITGTAELNANEVADGNVIFTAANALSELDTATVNQNNKDKASFTVKSIVSQGETARFTFEITNTNQEAYNMSFRAEPARTNDDARNYYSITAKMTNDSEEVEGTNTTTQIQIAANGTVTVEVTVQMTETPADGVTISANFQIELSVSEITGAASEET